MHSTLDKIHDLSDITDEEKQTLKTRIVEKRSDFADSVLAWEAMFSNAVDQVSTDLMNEINPLITKFE